MQMYTPFLAQQQQAGQQMQQMLNNAGSRVGAGIGAPPAGAQPSTLAMAQQNQLQSGTQLNFMPPAQRPAQFTSMLERAQRGLYPPAMVDQVRYRRHSCLFFAKWFVLYLTLLFFFLFFWFCLRIAPRLVPMNVNDAP